MTMDVSINTIIVLLACAGCWVLGARWGARQVGPQAFAFGRGSVGLTVRDKSGKPTKFSNYYASWWAGKIDLNPPPEEKKK